MDSFPLLIGDTLYDECIQDFIDNTTCTILKCMVCLPNADNKKHAIYRVRLTFKPTKKTIYITFQNQLQAYEPPHVSIEDVIVCLNADIIWWYEGSWTITSNGQTDRSFENYKKFYIKYNNPYYQLSEYVLFKNEIILLKKFFGEYFDAFYYLAL